MYVDVFDVSEDSEFKASAVLGQFFHVSNQAVQVCSFTLYTGVMMYVCIM